MNDEQVLGIDPGRQKVGLALVDASGAIVWRAIVPANEMRSALQTVFLERPITLVALGHSTGSDTAAEIVRAILQEQNHPATLQIVDERDSTLQARALYFEAHPPRGWRAWVPISLQTPPEAIDDFAAAILARRALQR
ncbi:MAG TPA: hypothetical protein VGB45_06555 [Abditibacterium sp.]|jgi:RNase H-fold protein (predicted Holliday junction resolvase)